MTKLETPRLAVDVIVFTVQDRRLKVLLIRRAIPPFKDFWALPGGFVNTTKDESLEAAAQRELVEETGSTAPYLEQLGSFGSAARDPRQWTATVCYFALIPYDKVNLSAGSDAKDAKWWTVHNSTVRTTLAFDHKDILNTAIERLRSKLEYTAIAGHLLGDEFTLPKLQETYEIILGEDLDKSSFRRSLSRSDIVEETGRQDKSKPNRPAKYYRFRKNTKGTLFFPRSIIRSLRN